MILRRYGNRVHSVTLDFDPAAMTEVGFRKDGVWEMDLGEFLDAHHMLREEEISATGTDANQDRAERAMLDALKVKFDAIYESLQEGQYLAVESKSGVDYPRTRYERSTLGDHPFTYSLDRPLRLGIWEKRPV
jgi:hypothetical protein